jgi:hypothetical protein
MTFLFIEYNKKFLFQFSTRIYDDPLGRRRGKGLYDHYKKFSFFSSKPENVACSNAKM